MRARNRDLFSSLVLVLVLVLAATAVQAAGSVSVKFVEPDRFADVRDARRDASDNLQVLAGHIESAAVRHMAEGDKLSVEVLDVDLAGEIRPSRRFYQEVRVLKGSVDWPRIRLRYTFEAAWQPPRSGEQTISDMAYLLRSSRASGEALGHEKRMLDAWFETQFAARRAP